MTISNNTLNMAREIYKLGLNDHNILLSSDRNANKLQRII